MKSEWKELSLGEITELVIDYRGKTPKKLGGDWSESGYRALSAKNIKTGHIVQPDTIRFVSEEMYHKWMKDEIQQGDIIITSEAPFGQILYWDSEEKIVLSQRLFGVRVKNEYDSRFVYYYMTTPDFQGEMDGRATGTTVVGLRQPELMKCVVHCPALETQKKIATILSSIDEKISMNERINENLLQQAQALYKNRFVDLKPFDGEMPPDWRLGTVSEIIELHDSKRIPLSSRERANLAKIYPYYGATSVMDYVDRYLFDGIYLLLGEDGTVVDSKGFPILQYVEGKFWVNNHAHIITGKNGFTVETLYLLFSLTNVQSIVTGAVQPKISQGNLNKVSVVIPSEAELSAFNSIVQPIFAQIRNLRAENDRLAATRDTLLPRLMSGELNVSSLDI